MTTKAKLYWMWLLSAVFGGLEFILPLFSETIPRGVFAFISFAVIVVSRISQFLTMRRMNQNGDPQQ